MLLATGIINALKAVPIEFVGSAIVAVQCSKYAIYLRSGFDRRLRLVVCVWVHVYMSVGREFQN